MNPSQMDSTQRIKALDPKMANGKAKELLDAVEKNTALFRTLSEQWPFPQQDFEAFSIFPERLRAGYCRSKLDTRLR